MSEIQRLSGEDFEVLKRERCEVDPRYGEIASRLKALFWDDTCNDLNLMLYERLEREAIIKGPVVRKHILSVAKSALKANNPVRYFAASIVRRLHEHGFLEDDSNDIGL